MHLCRLASGRTRQLLALAVLCAFVGAGCLYARAEKRVKPHKENRRSDSHQIESMEEQWRDAVLKNASAALEKMTTDDFLKRIGSHVNQFSTFELMVLKVRVQPGSAIATSQTHIVGTLDGRPVDAIFRYTKVYTRVAGGPWRVANFEATRVSRPRAGDSGMDRGMPLDTAPPEPR